MSRRFDCGKRIDIVWSSNFHKNLIDQLNTPNLPTKRFLHEFGSHKSTFDRLLNCCQIILNLQFRSSRVLIPDSNCLISKIIIYSSLILKKEYCVYLYPDGHLTTLPLKTPKWSRYKFKYSLKRDDALRLLKQNNKNESTSSKRRIEVISIKRPANISKKESLLLANNLIKSYIDAKKKENAGTRKSNLLSINILLHKNFPHRWILKTINSGEIRKAISAIEDKSVSFNIIDISNIEISNINTLHTLPSTLIWEIEGAKLDQDCTIVVYNYSSRFKGSSKKRILFESVYSKTINQMQASSRFMRVLQEDEDEENVSACSIWKLPGCKSYEIKE